MMAAPRRHWVEASISAKRASMGEGVASWLSKIREVRTKVHEVYLPEPGLICSSAARRGVSRGAADLPDGRDPSFACGEGMRQVPLPAQASLQVPARLRTGSHRNWPDCLTEQSSRQAFVRLVNHQKRHCNQPPWV